LCERKRGNEYPPGANNGVNRFYYYKTKFILFIPWGSGATAEDVKMVIPSPVPGPSSLILAGTGLSVVGCYMGFRRQRAAAVAA
jgi:hypothetical protein